jgi:hypothetical protein
LEKQNKRIIMKKLIYFTLGNNLNYIRLADLCIQSLYKSGYDGDFLFITDSQDHILNSITFKTSPLFLNINNSGLLESSANKLKLYKFDKINDYDKIIFSDLDILWTKNPDIIFNEINEDKFYMSNENSLMSNEWWGAKILNDEEKNYININNINGVNAGIFAFNNNMVKHLKNIDDFLNNNLHLSNECLEQPFLNVYLFRNELYNTKLNGYVTHNGYHLDRYDGVALHFAGGPGNFSVKYDKMINFYNKNF